MSSHAILPEGTPHPAGFKPKDNPAFILYDKLKTGYEEQPIPELGPDEVLIEIKKTGICGSDVHFYNTGAMGLVALEEPMCLGHESAGIIVQLGSNNVVGKGALQLGDKVALEPGVTCRMCTDCRGGCYQICEHMVFAAYPPSRGGTLQRYYKLPADLVYRLPSSVALEYGAMMEPLSVAVHAVANKGGMKTGYNVLIFGAGPVGLLAMAVAKGMGANRIVGVDNNRERLDFAKGYAATDVYIPIKQNENESRPQYSVRAASDLLLSFGIPPRGPGSIDLVVDATGAEVCIQMGLNAVKPGGTYVQTGFGPPDIQIPMFRVTTNEITIKGGWRYGNGDYPLAIDLVNRGLVNLQPLLTHTFKFKDALEAFEITKAGRDKDGKFVIKCVIDGPE
ncbi:chlorophyll synthesis pathway protein BchC [Kwoniella bestiolae CBS 10118]|uniref:Chlorophyll synthesis pathway protein BchC n=1 Tax=Kwoniella bestiolae CBS 10118 TaxID=1296100 RepID=A0A1B9G2B5_9TREE|nr:chlorophyll synthesis pathway protein BchC [Kwoniella bestiolae CBS 10118]OCF25167.1 chlorophyll synthesis pathway protein BchC [Kwoniella bestiolae CBS 10118]